MQHKHAEFFIAIANGESIENWECGYISDIARYPQNWKVRRKQATHKVNGFTVPAPMKTEPNEDVVYHFPVLTSPLFYASRPWSGSISDKPLLKRGLIHLTNVAAVANAKAMCGINPESKDE